MNRILFLLLLAAGFDLAAAHSVKSQAPHPALPPLVVPNGAGVNIHFTDPRPGEMKMLTEGFRFVRTDFGWGGTERVKGQYDFTAYDHLMKALDEVKVRPLFILDYGNDLYDDGLSPHTDEGRAAMAKWAAAAVTHFKGRGVLWEMFNEPNIGFWKPTPNVDDYVLMAKAVATAIRAAQPKECHFGAATSGIDLKFLEACFKAGLLQQWDAVSVHPYRQNDPESASAEYRKLRLLIEKYKPKGKKIPIISGEWGYSTAWDKFDYERQGKYLTRQWMTNLMNDVPLSIWYDWHDDGLDPKESEHHFGSVENAYFENRNPVYDPKPSYKAARAFTQFFGGYTFNKRLTLASPDDYLLLFEKKGAVKIAVWTTKAPHEIAIPASPGAFRITNYLGEAQPDAKAEQGGLKLTVSDAPLYLEPVAANALLFKAAKWGRLPLEYFVKAPYRLPQGYLFDNHAPLLGRDAAPQTMTEASFVSQSTEFVVTNPLHISLFPAGANNFQVRLENPSGDAFTGKVSLNGGAAQNIAFAAGETEKIFAFARPTPQNGVLNTTLRFQGNKKDDVVESVRSFRAYDDFARHADLSQAYRVTPDGDAQIVSEQSLSIAPPADGPSPGGGAALKLSYRMEPGWKFLQIQPLSDDLKKVEGQPKALGMWVYGDKSNNTLRMRFRDASSQTFQPNGAPISWQGWKYYEFPIDNSGGNWGGDGVIHWPISVDTLALLDSDKKPDNKGEIYISAPVWAY